MRKSTGFLWPLLTIYFIFTLIIGLNFAVLWKSGELLPLEEIIQRQEARKALYNALSIGFADYKYAAYRVRSPEIVAFGTSRAMQIRQSFFNKSFYNLGGLVQGPGQANVLADNLLLKGVPPKVLIFALDYWTFCRLETDRAPDKSVREIFHDGMGQPQRQFLIYQLLFQRRFSAKELITVLTSPISVNSDLVGLGAEIGKSGFAADGSIYSLAPEDGPLQRRWEEAFDRIKSGTGQMVKDCVVSPIALGELDRFVGRMRKAGSKVVLIMAPLPSSVVERMQSDGRYGYIANLRALLAARYPQGFFDFYDMRNEAADSEFYDGLHGGEIAYRRIILAIARKPTAPLHGLVDEGLLQSQITRWSGRSQMPDDPIVRKFSLQAPRRNN